MKAAIAKGLGTEDFKGVRVAVQGCGNVARFVCKHLYDCGAKLFVSDIVVEKAKLMNELYGAEIVAPEEIYDAEADVYCPCALGATINDDTLPRLKAKVIAGGANNQCLTVEHGDRLREHEIIYAPDFVINAGGIINVSVELEPDGYNEERAMVKVKNIYNAVRDILDTAEKENIATNRAAILLAERKIAAGRKN
jgi:leucine dehydrogenase